VNLFRSGNGSFVWLLWFNAAMAVILTLLLLATAVSRHLVLPQKLYLGAALTGFLGRLAFLGAGGEIFHYRADGPSFAGLASLALVLSYFLLAEAALLWWRGVHKS
jgi:hypothetical protein